MSKLPVTIRLEHHELDRLRAEARSFGVSFSTLVRDRLGIQPAPGVQVATDLSERVNLLEARVAELEQLAAPY